jgi:hypothetical protein
LRSQTVGIPTQQRVIYAGTQIYRESGGTMVSIKTGLEAGKMPAFEVMNDDLIMTTTSTVDVPLKYDQTSVANLGGSPPNFHFHVNHKDRLWAAGVESAKSRLYYSALGNHEDWTGVGSGSIDVSPDDGDVLRGLASHKDELIIWKGPNTGGIYRLSGSAPSGSDAFALHPFVIGVGATNHQSIIRVRDDLLFWDDGGLHSLFATANYGDYSAAFLSADLSSFVTSSLNHARFDAIWGVNVSPAGRALWTVSKAGSLTNDLIIMWDYRFDRPRFALWPAYQVASLAIVRDTSRTLTPWSGTYTGRVLRMNQPGRNIAGTAYAARAVLPYLSFGDPFLDKLVGKGRVGFAPKGDTTFEFKYQRDGALQQIVTVAQGGTATLAPSSNQFVLDSDALGVLGGGRYHQAFFDMEGQFKEIQISLEQGTLDVDFEPHSVALDIEGAGIGTTEILG